MFIYKKTRAYQRKIVNMSRHDITRRYYRNTSMSGNWLCRIEFIMFYIEVLYKYCYE